MVDIPTNRKQQAQTYCRRALDYYEQGNHAAAVKALGTALDLDRSLRDDPRIQRFAARLVGQPADQAVDALTDLPSREALALRIGKRKPRKSASVTSNPLWIAGIVIVTVAIVGLIALFSLGLIGFYAPNVSQVERHTLSQNPDQDYFLAAPNGSVPEDGWQTVVAIHGVGQTGQDMVDMFGEMVRSRGILLIAPTFPAIRDSAVTEGFYETARVTLQAIIDEVTIAGLTNPRFYGHYLGQVYMGYGEGAPLATYIAMKGLDYADSGYVMEGPIGVALVNARAPLFDAPRYPIPYLLLYGEHAPQTEISRAYYDRLTRQGTEVYLIEGKGAEASMTDEQRTIVVDFVQQVYVPPTAVP